MLKPVQIGNALPVSYVVDPSAVFMPGNIAELKIIGNDIVVGVSTGLAPIGIIDDINTVAFTQPAIDEEIIFGPDLIGTPTTDANGQLVTAHDVQAALENPYIIKDSFSTDYPVIINYKNGIIKVPSGSFLNYASTAGSTLDSIKVIVNYTYQVPDMIGQNSTIGSGRVTIWFERGIFQTDIYSTAASYSLNCTLYCGLDGKLTSIQPTPNHPGVAICLGPPTVTNNMLEFMWM